MEKKVPRKSNWKVRAGKARQDLRGARHGEKDVALIRNADGQDANTVRREIFALDYLDRLARSDPALRTGLEASSVSIVELLARWHAFDPKGALKAARKAAKGGFTVSGLSKAMTDARREGGLQFEATYRERIADAALDAVRDLIDGDIYLDETTSKESIDPPTDFRYRRRIGSPPRDESIVAIVVGPYQDPNLYGKRRRDWLYKAFGLAWFVDHVVVLLPHAPAVEDYRAWVSQARARAKAGGSASPAGRRRVPSVLVAHPNPYRGKTITDDEVASLIKANVHPLPGHREKS